MPHTDASQRFRRFGRASRRARRGVLAALGLALAGLAACTSQPSPQNSPPTATEKAYVRNIQVSGASMTAAKNFLQHTVTTLHAQIANRGGLTVRYVELELSFNNFMGQVDLREKAHPVNLNTPPLQPAEARDFEVSFDHVPDDWNQAPPTITVTRVLLAEEK